MKRKVTIQASIQLEVDESIAQQILHARGHGRGVPLTLEIELCGYPVDIRELSASIAVQHEIPDQGWIVID